MARAPAVAAPAVAPVVQTPTESSTQSSDHSAPAKAVPVSPAIKKWTIVILVVIAAIIGVGQIAKIVRNNANQQAGAHFSKTAVPLTSWPIDAWPEVVIPPRGRSRDIVLPLGMHHIMTRGVGTNKFKLHTVYEDHECVNGEGCGEGAVTHYYVTNESDQVKKVRYAFDPIVA